MPMSRLVCVAGVPCSFTIFAKDRCVVVWGERPGAWGGLVGPGVRVAGFMGCVALLLTILGDDRGGLDSRLGFWVLGFRGSIYRAVRFDHHRHGPVRCWASPFTLNPSPQALGPQTEGAVSSLAATATIRMTSDV